MVFLPVLLSIVGPKAYLETEANDVPVDVVAYSSESKDCGEAVKTSKVQPVESSTTVVEDKEKNVEGMHSVVDVIHPKN